MGRFLPTDAAAIGSLSYIGSGKDVLTQGGKTFLRSGVLAKRTSYPDVPAELSANFIDVMDNVTSPAPVGYNDGYGRVAYGNGIFVALGVSNNVLTTHCATSPDGINWTDRALPANIAWVDVIFGGGLFVAIAGRHTTSAQCATSPDGINWTLRAIPAASWARVAYGNGQFVAVAGNVTGSSVTSDWAATSPDGINWTKRTLPVAANWLAIAYGSGPEINSDTGLFAVIADSKLYTSPDGITWTLRTVPAYAYTDIAFGNDTFVVTTGGVLVNTLTSRNGEDWTDRAFAAYVKIGKRTIAFGAGMFVADCGANASKQIAISMDGSTWTPRPTTPNAPTQGIAFGAGVFASVGLNGFMVGRPDEYVGAQNYVPNLYMRVK